MNPAKVSIITACRNSGATIEDAILSVAGQTYANIEHIIVDAVSDDGTAGIIQKHKERISAWIRESDNGIAEAWNKGIGIASGDVVGILNADDRYMPATVSTVVDILTQRQDCGFVYGDLGIETQDGVFSHIEKAVPGYERETRFDMLHVPHPTVFVRRTVYDRIGLFDPAYRIAFDYEFIRRMASAGITGEYLPVTLAIMRQGGLSHAQNTRAFREVRDISVRYGYNRGAAACYLYFKLVRTHLGLLFDRLGISALDRRKARTYLKKLASRAA